MSVLCAWVGEVKDFKVVEGATTIAKAFLSITLQTDGVGFFGVTVFDDAVAQADELEVGDVIYGTGRVSKVRGWVKKDGAVGTQLSIIAPGFSRLPPAEHKMRNGGAEQDGGLALRSRFDAATKSGGGDLSDEVPF
jgi:hypothetical protein